MEPRPAKEPGSGSPSTLSDNSKVSSTSPVPEVTRQASAVLRHEGGLGGSSSSSSWAKPLSGKASPGRSGEAKVPDLAARLALAEAELRDHSGPGSTADSEERDPLSFAQQVEEELERRSNAGSLASSDGQSGHGRGKDARLKEVEELLQKRDIHSHSDHSKSGSSSSLSREGGLTKHQKQSLEEDPKSSSSSSNTHQHRTNMELWELLLDQQQEKAKVEDNIVELREMMEAMAEKHGMEMEVMQRQLRKTLKREMAKSEEKALVVSQIAGKEAKHSKTVDELQERVEEVARAKKAIEEEKGDLQDLIAGQEARANIKVKNVKAEYQAKMEEEQREKEEAKKAKEEVKMELTAQSAVLEQQLMTVKVQSKNAAAERDVLRRNLQTMQATHNEQVNCLKEQLDAANRELKKVVKNKMEKSGDTATVEVPASEIEKVVDLREQLAQSREKHREMTDELSELRLQMLGMKQNSEQHTEQVRAEARAESRAEVGDLQMLLDAANMQLQDISTEPTTKGSMSLKLPQRRGFGPKMMKVKGKNWPLNKLTSIDEDDMSSMDGSAAASGNVSSDGGDEVGDLHDFDEAAVLPNFDGPLPLAPVLKQVVQQKNEFKSQVEDLRNKLAEDHTLVDEVKEELAEKEARHASKVARLLDVVETTREVKAKAMQEVAELKVDVKVKDAEHAAQVEELQEMLAASERRCDTILEEKAAAAAQQERPAGPVAAPKSEADPNDPTVEGLRQQLFCALEAKRIAEGRVEEFKRAMATMERQHNDTVADFKQQLLVAGSSHRSRDGSLTESTATSASDELEDLKQQLRSSVEERNVLTNSLEWKEVQWKSKVENMEMNHAAETAELKRAHEAEVKELTLRLEGELAEVRQRWEASQQEKTQLEEKANAPSVVALAPSWLSRLRCPVRGIPGGGSSSSGGAAYCQDVCWRILNTIQGITALLCSIRDYKIVEATRTACMTWGSAALHGQSVLTLVNGPSRAAWLRKAFQMHQSIADTQNEGVPGFVVRDLGCEEFTSKTGQAFDSSVITAHLPAEPSCNKEAALLVIIEPQNNQRGAPAAASSSAPQQPVGRVEHRAGNQSSAHSEVSTVDPCDSASNIFDRNMGMFSRG